MPVQVPPGFILLNGKYILVRVVYSSPNENEPVPNYEYQRIIEPELCEIGNAIGALPMATDAFSVTVPYGDADQTMSLRCVVRLRFFRRPQAYNDTDVVNGIVPDIVASFVVDGDR